MKKMLTACLLLIGLATFAMTTYAVPKEKESVFKTELSISKMSVETDYSLVITPSYLTELNNLMQKEHLDIVVQDLKRFELYCYSYRYRWQVPMLNCNDKKPSLKFLSCNTVKVPPKLRC